MQPWDYIIANNLNYLEGNIVKYVSRWRQKGGVEDLRKAKHYLEKLIEVETGEQPPTTVNDAAIRAQRATWDARAKG
jgi:hypothetical protein